MDPATDAPVSTNLRNTALVFLGVLALISLIAAVVAANTPVRQRTRSAADPRTLPAPSTATPAPASPSATADSGQGGGAGTDQGAGAGMAQVVSFRVRQQPECRPGRSVPAIVEWTVSGTPSATLVDNNHKVGSYAGTTGSRTLEFACSGTPGSTEKHTYTLTTDSGSPPCTQTVTASATVPAKPSIPPSLPPASKAPASTAPHAPDTAKY